MFSTVKRQYAVGNEFRDAFVKVVVELINAAGVLFHDFFGVCDSGCNQGVFEKQGTRAAAHAGILSNDLCGDITRSCIGFQARFHTFSCIQERVRVFFKDGIYFPLSFWLLQDDFSQRGETFLTGDAGTSFAFGAIG